MKTGRYTRIIVTLLLLLLTYGHDKVWADTSFSKDGITVIIDGGIANGTIIVKGGTESPSIVTNTDESHTVTLTVTPNVGYYITSKYIYVEKMKDFSTTRAPGVADYLPVTALANDLIVSVSVSSSGDYTFTIPKGMTGAYVTAEFKEATDLKFVDQNTQASEITASDGTYVLTADVNASIFANLYSNDFTGILNGEFEGVLHTIDMTGNSHALFNKINGGTVKNVFLKNVSISSGTNIGAIANEVTGTTEKRAYIYNCGVMDGSVSGSGYVGGLVGLLGNPANNNAAKAQCYARVINCYSFANVSGGSWAGGIVGYNSYASKSSDIRSMVMNCMFYGDITAGTKSAPIYGGTKINNTANNGLNNYNYYAYEKLKNRISEKTITNYNNAMAAEEDYLVRFEFYRLLLNSNRKLAAAYVGDNASNMAKWVLDKSIASYPILKVQGTYPSVVNYDKDYTYDAEGNKVRRNNISERSHGKELGTPLSVTVNLGSDYPSGASIIKSSLSLKRTDKDTLNYNFNYDKVQLPYYNEVGIGNYTHNKVVTGWKITNISGGESGTFKEGDEWGGYNFADRKCTNKDKFSGGGRVFSQGAYFDVPYGVTSITIEPYWGNAAYVSDATYDVLGIGMTAGVNGDQYTNDTEYSINGNNQKVYTSIANALSDPHLTGSKVYDNAIVLVGNLHQSGSPSSGTKPFTIMSVDLDKDNEPDCSLIYNHSGRAPVSPIRFDFINVPGTAMVLSTNRTMTIFNPRGWFEVTNTCLVHFIQFEYDNGNKDQTPAPVIFQGGLIDQFVSTKSSNPVNHTDYILLGGNAKFETFSNGTHSDGNYFTPHIPISVTGGDYNKFYLSGIYKPTANFSNDNAECYISGGRFDELAGSGMQKIDGNVQWQIYDSDIKNFYGGGINAKKNISGNITVDIFNSHVDAYCGGPKFGDMESGKEVRTTAEGCTFGNYYGAGYGGASLNRLTIYNTSKNIDWSTWVSNTYAKYRGKYLNTIEANYGNNGYTEHGAEADGIATDIDYEYFLGSDGNRYGRLYIDFASFSLAKTHNVYSSLTDCIISGNFYGGGKFGQVNGKATSNLSNCKVYGNVFGGGYSGEVQPIAIRDVEGFSKIPDYNTDASVFIKGELGGTTPYKWVHVDQSEWSVITTTNHNIGNAGATDTNEGNLIKTPVDFTTLGQVENTELIIDGATYVRGIINGTIPDLENDNGFMGIDGETLYGVATGGETIGGVFGGGDASMVKENATVIIKNTRAEGIYNVYGGGNTAEVGGDASVTLKGNTVVLGNVFGGGNQGIVQGSTTVNIEN